MHTPNSDLATHSQFSTDLCISTGLSQADIMIQSLPSIFSSPDVVDPRNCYAPEPEGEVEEVGVSLSEGVVFVDTSDLPTAEAVIPTTPVKAGQKQSSTSSDVSVMLHTVDRCNRGGDALISEPRPSVSSSVAGYNMEVASWPHPSVSNWVGGKGREPDHTLQYSVDLMQNYLRQQI